MTKYILTNTANKTQVYDASRDVENIGFEAPLVTIYCFPKPRATVTLGLANSAEFSCDGWWAKPEYAYH